jgi:hypothetical protein
MTACQPCDVGWVSTFAGFCRECEATAIPNDELSGCASYSPGSSHSRFSAVCLAGYFNVSLYPGLKLPGSTNPGNPCLSCERDLPTSLASKVFCPGGRHGRGRSMLWPRPGFWIGAIAGDESFTPDDRRHGFVYACMPPEVCAPPEITSWQTMDGITAGDDEQPLLDTNVLHCIRNPGDCSYREWVLATSRTSNSRDCQSDPSKCCAPHHGGVLCSNCSDVGYYKMADQKCVICPHSKLSAVFMLLIGYTLLAVFLDFKARYMYDSNGLNSSAVACNSASCAQIFSHLQGHQR